MTYSGASCSRMASRARRSRLRPARPRHGLDQQRVLGDREDMRAVGLAVPARDAGEPVRDVVDLDVERGGVEQIEPAARQHALPGAETGRLRWRQPPASFRLAAHARATCQPRLNTRLVRHGVAACCSLPPCGGGMGRGVKAISALRLGYPPPDRSQAGLRTVDLPLKGGGEARKDASLALAELLHASWRWHFTRWSLTMPTACMKA